MQEPNVMRLSCHTLSEWRVTLTFDLWGLQQNCYRV